MSNSVEERFLALFRSNPESFVIRKRVEATPDENGKREAEYTTLSRAVTSAECCRALCRKNLSRSQA